MIVNLLHNFSVFYDTIGWLIMTFIGFLVGATSPKFLSTRMVIFLVLVVVFGSITIIFK
jgi:intracellular septation protein A